MRKADQIRSRKLAARRKRKVCKGPQTFPRLMARRRRVAALAGSPLSAGLALMLAAAKEAGRGLRVECLDAPRLELPMFAALDREPRA